MDKMKNLFVVNIVISIVLLVGFIFMLISVNKVMATLDNKKAAVVSKEVQDIPEEQIEIISVDEAIRVNIYDNEDVTENKHMLYLKAAIGLNNKADDFKSLNEQLKNKMDFVRSNIADVIRQKSYEEVIRPESKMVLEKEVLEMLREKYNTGAIVRVEFADYFHQ